MMLDAIDNHTLIQRTILMLSQAYVERGTNMLFIPLVEEVWRNDTNGTFIRILANKRRRVNAKAQYFKDNFYPVVLSWNTLFRANPDTMIITK